MIVLHAEPATDLCLENGIAVRIEPGRSQIVAVLTSRRLDDDGRRLTA